MELIEIFQILGIEETKDEKAIKNAYREKLTVTNPEDNPEGFKRLRAAYDEACRFAAEEDAGETEEEKDTTPSGLWVEKAAAVYGRIDTRMNPEEWKALFEEDIFLSLEEEENCCNKLLRFLMDHYRLPSEVWKLLDEKMKLVDNASGLREHFPADFINYVVSKCERGEDVEFHQFEGAPDAEYDLFLQYYDRCWQSLQEENLEQAAEYIRNADDLHIYHPVMEICRANLLKRQDKKEEAIRVLEQLRERFPKDSMVGYNTAEMLWHHDDKAKAAAIYESMKAENNKHYMSNVRLTEWYYMCGKYKEAKECAEEILSMGADDDFMELLGKVNHELEKDMEEKFASDDWRTGLDLCWCYLQDGRASRGIRVALELDKLVPDDKRAEYNGLMTKLYIEANEYEKSVEMAEVWEKSLYEKLKTDETKEEEEKDRDRIRQSHAIRMQCYHSLGYCDKKYFEEAIKEIEGMESNSSRDIGLMLEKAQIYMEMAEYEKALEITDRLIKDYQVYAAFATAQEVHRRMWDAQGVVESGRACIQYFPNYVRAYELIAKVYLDLKYTDDLKAILAEAKEKELKSPILEAFEYQMEHTIPEEIDWNKRIAEFRENYLTKVEDGNLEYYEKGLPVITEYLYTFIGTYLLVERGIFHKAANHLEEAKEDFEKALAENPAHPYALNSLSFVYKYQKDYDKALSCIKRAILYLGKEASPSMYADMADIYSLLGECEMAVEAYEKFLELAGDAGSKSKYYMRHYAECLTKCNKMEKALATIDVAFPDAKAGYNGKVFLYHLAGQKNEATKALSDWIKLLMKPEYKLDGPEYDDYYSNKAWHELLFGNYEDAVDAFEKWIKCRENKNGVGAPLCDMIFACILYGDEERGKFYAEKLNAWREKEEQEGRDYYFEMDMSRLQMEILAAYYTAGPEELEEKFASVKACQLCHTCIRGVCKEIEGVYILYLIQKGEKEAAFERLNKNLKEARMDEYMYAIMHRYENEEEQRETLETEASEQKGLFSKLGKLFGKK